MRAAGEFAARFYRVKVNPRKWRRYRRPAMASRVTPKVMRRRKARAELPLNQPIVDLIDRVIVPALLARLLREQQQGPAQPKEAA